MALTTTYSLTSLLGLDLSAGPSTVATDVAALAGGGFVGAGSLNGRTALDFFDGGAVHTGGNTSINGTGASVLGLADGSVLVVSIVSNATIYSIRALDGTIIVGETQSSPVTSGANLSVDVASLGRNDFIIASNTQGVLSGTPQGVHLYRSVNGIAEVVLVPKQIFSQIVSDPSVSGIGNGNAMVAYTSADSTGTEIGLAYWDADDTSIMLSPRIADNRGTINRNPSVVDTPGAGFGIAYETDSQSDSLDIVFSLFSDTGTRLATFDISNPTFASQGFDETNATATMLTNTLVAITYTARSTATRNEPPVSKVALFDLTTNTTVAGLSISSLFLTDSINPLVAGLENGQLAFFATNTSSGSPDAFGRLLQASRVQTGDAANDLITGDELKDVMFGGDGNDTLIGGRGAADDMHGGNGADLFRIVGRHIAAGEVIAGDGGADRILLTGGAARLDLATLTSIERLDFAGRGVMTATLNAGQIGNGGLSILASLTGRITDADNLVVNMGAAAVLNLSHLTMIDWQDSGATPDRVVITGDGNDEIVRGSVVADTIGLGAGDDVLDGDLGRDILTGGAGADRFMFSSAIGNANIDRITDFQTGVDQLRLEDAVFAGLALGRLANAAFQLGTAANSAQDRIIYDAQTGALFYDADGDGASVQQRFATLSPGTALVAADILVF